MDLVKDKIRQVKKLVNTMLDEGATPERMQTLMTLLDHNQVVCEAYLDFMMLHGCLQHQLCGETSEDTHQPRITEIRARRKWTPFNLKKNILSIPLLLLGSLLQRTLI